MIYDSVHNGDDLIVVVSVREKGVVGCSDYPIDAIGWIGRESVMISTLNLTLSMPSKSFFPDQ
jgi:hypothetical protein